MIIAVYMMDDKYSDKKKMITVKNVITLPTSYNALAFLHISTLFATKLWPKQWSIKEKTQTRRNK